jgi:anti-sigma B factor antagonist
MSPQPPPLVSRTTRDGDAWTITLAGEIDLYNSTSVNREFELILESTPTPAVLFVDLAQITFMDSMGIGILLAAHQRAAAVGCRFTVSSMSPVIESLLKMSGLTHALTADGSA